MRLFYYLVFVLCVANGYSQTVTVEDSSRSPEALVNLLLGNACAQVSAPKISSPNSVAYFNNNGGTFPLSEGVLIRSGKAKYSEGIYTGAHMSSSENTNGDAFLQALNAESGQNQKITDAAFLEFEFTPLSSNFNFNFLFASNEYGEYQCYSSDVFAFILTDMATGEKQNLAVIPDTNIPVSVKNIKDEIYQSGCESVYPELFDRFNVIDPESSTINMRGYTVVFNAAAQTSPGHHYKIRLVIGDANDSQYDSAIFIQAGSFDTNVDLGNDFDLCQGNEEILTTRLDASLYQHTWYKDGKKIGGETNNTLTVTQSGTYEVEISQNNKDCKITDKVVVSTLQVDQPKDIEVCNSGEETHPFNLTQNDARTLGLNPDRYQIKYYASQTDLNNLNPIPKGQLTNYTSTGDQRVFIKINDNQDNASCDAVYHFVLKVKKPISLSHSNPIQVCAASKEVQVDLTENQSQILSGSDESTLEFSYYTSLENAENGNKIQHPNRFKVLKSLSPKTIWVRVTDKNDPDCYATTNFDVILNSPPLVDQIEDQIECSEYVLPPIINGNYFTKSDGKGEALFAGDVITENGTYYIFNGPNGNGCTSQSSFEVTLLSNYDIAKDHCGKFIVPKPPKGNFYTAPNGPNGNGEVIPTKTRITSNQTLYYYAKINDQLCRDSSMDIRIFPLPEIDHPEDVIACEPYNLPQLQNGDYYTKPNGNGKKLNTGDALKRSKTLYVYNNDGRCDNEYSFHVSIVPTFEDRTECGNYTLPKLEVGNFYTQAAGKGDQLPEEAVIERSREIYYYVETTVGENCSKNESFKLTIIPLPPVDSLEDTMVCEDVRYQLPELTNGNYFTKPDRQGKKLSSGDIIGATQTVFINNLEGGCTNESNFKVTVQPLPKVEIFTNILQCDPYILPQLKHGTYYTGPGATGEVLNAGDVIDSDVKQRIYIYNDDEKLSSCYSETSFTVKVNYIDLGEFETINSCDNYVLPDLNVGAYYSATGGPGGKDSRLYTGDILSKSQTIYVWAKKDTRFSCEFEKSFKVNISITPALNPFKNIKACGNYTLPRLPQDEYDMYYYRKSGGGQKIEREDYTITEPGTYTIYVQAQAKNNIHCTDEKNFQLIIYPLRDFSVANAALCRDPQTGNLLEPAHLESKMDSNLFEVEWYFKRKLVHKGVNYDATEAGTYTVKTIKKHTGNTIPHSSLDCNFRPTTIEVTESSLPVITAKVTEDFRESAIVTVNIIAGIGDFEYQLDDGPFQRGNEFYDVGSGAHKVYVRAIKGFCGIASVPVQVIKYPKFFTPNNDGINDIWNISDLQDHPEAKVKIFTRYGKLLKTIRVSGNGWDGNFNGKAMPSDDYWFQVDYQKNGTLHQFRSHFTLKR